jgi:two-component system, LytTR family, sensor kinase
MKSLLSCLLFWCICFSVDAQPTIDTVAKLTFYNEWTKIMESDPNDQWSRYGPNQRFQIFNRWSSLPSLKQKSAAHISFYGNAALTWLNGQPQLELAAAGITKANADSFLYHVVVNDSIEIVPWQHPSVFKTNSLGTYAYLGKFESLHKLIKLEIYHTGQYYDKKTIYYNNLYTPSPVIAKARLLYNDPHLFNPQKQHYIPHKKNIQIGGYEVDPSTAMKKEIQHRSFEWSDSINHIQLSMEPTLLNEMYYVYLRHYSNAHSDTSFISNKWNISYYSKNPEMTINASYFKKPGNYEVIIVTQIPEEFNRKNSSQQTSLFFTVKPSSIVQFSSRQAIMYTAFLAFVGGTGFFYYRGRNKRQLEKKTQEKQMALLQLRAVRSQLNPHFMFNALSGIQNLMNKNEGNKASNYLSRFARITRHILKESEQDLTSIQDEIKLLEDYLLMEQLRFGFQYNITVAKEIDQSHTDIPAMLLQPIVENAVKHGVSGLSANGYIDLSIMQQGHSLVLQVKDNGNGFSLTDQTDGHGLKLVRERIQLLNKLYPDTTIHFEVLSTTGFCICQIELNNWI